jgi:predicted metal-binding membrane protein
MHEHVHTGPYMFLWVGLSALVFLNLVRLLAIWAAQQPGLEWLARMLGGAITFSGVPAR